MEKISALIDKLQELKNSNAGLQSISYYTQLLQAEINHQRNLQKQQELKGHGHVAVILPAQTQAPVMERPAPPPPPPPPPQQQEKEISLQPNGYAQDRIPVKARGPEQPATLFDPPPPPPRPAEPSHTENNNGIRKELNELIAKTNTSLNDTLRSNGKELGEKLGGMGVKDLKDAIGINDKFQFIQELFRSDKNMYDRCIKTINECTSLQEAENWIERELKIKEGWDEQAPVVQQFYALVRKRFS